MRLNHYDSKCAVSALVYDLTPIKNTVTDVIWGHALKQGKDNSQNAADNKLDDYEVIEDFSKIEFNSFYTGFQAFSDNVNCVKYALDGISDTFNMLKNVNNAIDKYEVVILESNEANGQNRMANSKIFVQKNADATKKLNIGRFINENEEEIRNGEDLLKYIYSDDYNSNDIFITENDIGYIVYALYAKVFANEGDFFHTGSFSIEDKEKRLFKVLSSFDSVYDTNSIHHDSQEDKQFGIDLEGGELPFGYQHLFVRYIEKDKGPKLFITAKACGTAKRGDFFAHDVDYINSLFLKNDQKENARMEKDLVDIERVNYNNDARNNLLSGNEAVLTNVLLKDNEVKILNYLNQDDQKDKLQDTHYNKKYPEGYVKYKKNINEQLNNMSDALSNNDDELGKDEQFNQAQKELKKQKGMTKLDFKEKLKKYITSGLLALKNTNWKISESIGSIEDLGKLEEQEEFKIEQDRYKGAKILMTMQEEYVDILRKEYKLLPEIVLKSSKLPHKKIIQSEDRQNPDLIGSYKMQEDSTEIMRAKKIALDDLIIAQRNYLEILKKKIALDDLIKKNKEYVEILKKKIALDDLIIAQKNYLEVVMVLKNHLEMKKQKAIKKLDKISYHTQSIPLITDVNKSKDTDLSNAAKRDLPSPSSDQLQQIVATSVATHSFSNVNGLKSITEDDISSNESKDVASEGSDTKSRNFFEKDMPEKAILGKDISCSNAFSESMNKRYLYQADDINMIGEQIFQGRNVEWMGYVSLIYSDNIYYPPPILLRPVVGIYNNGAELADVGHWVAFIVQIDYGSNISVLYKNSLGGEEICEDFINLLKIKYQVYCENSNFINLDSNKQQYDGTSCGIFALRNADIIVEKFESMRGSGSSDAQNKVVLTKNDFIVGGDFGGFVTQGEVDKLRDLKYKEHYFRGVLEKITNEELILSEMKSLIRKKLDDFSSTLASDLHDKLSQNGIEVIFIPYDCNKSFAKLKEGKEKLIALESVIIENDNSQYSSTDINTLKNAHVAPIAYISAECIDNEYGIQNVLNKIFDGNTDNSNGVPQYHISNIEKSNGTIIYYKVILHVKEKLAINAIWDEITHQAKSSLLGEDERKLNTAVKQLRSTLHLKEDKKITIDNKTETLLSFIKNNLTKYFNANIISDAEVDAKSIAGSDNYDENVIKKNEEQNHIIPNQKVQEPEPKCESFIEQALAFATKGVEEDKAKRAQTNKTRNAKKKEKKKEKKKMEKEAHAEQPYIDIEHAAKESKIKKQNFDTTQYNEIVKQALENLNAKDGKEYNNPIQQILTNPQVTHPSWPVFVISVIKHLYALLEMKLTENFAGNMVQFMDKVKNELQSLEEFIVKHNEVINFINNKLEQECLELEIKSEIVDILTASKNVLHNISCTTVKIIAPTFCGFRFGAVRTTEELNKLVAEGAEYKTVNQFVAKEWLSFRGDTVEKAINQAMKLNLEDADLSDDMKNALESNSIKYIKVLENTSQNIPQLSSMDLSAKIAGIMEITESSKCLMEPKGEKSRGLEQKLGEKDDGMSDADVNFNLNNLNKYIKSLPRLNGDIYLHDSILLIGFVNEQNDVQHDCGENSIINLIKNWKEGNLSLGVAAKKLIAVVALVNNKREKHAILLSGDHAADGSLDVTITNSLSSNVAFQEVFNMLGALLSRIDIKYDIVNTGEQNEEEGTCADISLIRILEVIEKKHLLIKGDSDIKIQNSNDGIGNEDTIIETEQEGMRNTDDMYRAPVYKINLIYEESFDIVADGAVMPFRQYHKSDIAEGIAKDFSEGFIENLLINTSNYLIEIGVIDQNMDLFSRGDLLKLVYKSGDLIIKVECDSVTNKIKYAVVTNKKEFLKEYNSNLKEYIYHKKYNKKSFIEKVAANIESGISYVEKANSVVSDRA